MTGEVPGSRGQGSGSRIPLALQAVFIASNRGKNVDKPPPERAAHKTYFRNWMFKGLGKKKKAKSNGKHRDSKPPTVVQFGADEGEKDPPELISTQPEKAESKTPSVSKIKVSKWSFPFTLQPSCDALLIMSCDRDAVQPSSRPPMSPQAYLDVLIHSRGYSTRRYRTLQTGYYSKPTAFQQASYNVHLVKLVRANDVKKLRTVMQAGISPNPCNAYGESLVHMVCRRGDHELLKMLLDCGTSIQVSDDYGRTPLHDACWAAKPSFETVELIAAKDITLFHMTDSRGAVPLSYVRREHWPLWIDFFEAKKDEWWPPKAEEDIPSALIDVAPNERPITEPDNALTIELASMVASGVMTPEEAKLLMEDDEEDEASDDDDEDSVSETDHGDSEDSDDVSDYDSDDDDDGLEGFTADDMANMLSRLKYSKQQSQ